jgi:hypothetical protein
VGCHRSISFRPYCIFDLFLAGEKEKKSCWLSPDMFFAAVRNLLSLEHYRLVELLVYSPSPSWAYRSVGQEPRMIGYSLLLRALHV